MWIGDVSSKELFKANRWTVSFFSHTRSALSSAFSLLPLSQIVSERRGSADPQQMGDALITYLGLENVRPHTGELVDFASRPATSVKSRSKVFFQNDVLYGRLRPELNKVYLADGEASEGLCSGEFIVLVPDTKLVDSRYLRHILASPFVASFALKLRAGASLPRLTTQDLLSLEVPVPPMEIQLRLSRKLARIDSEIAQLRQRLASLPDLETRGLMNAIADGSSDLDV
jgi:type I restriction enzyme S subunit